MFSSTHGLSKESKRIFQVEDARISAGLDYLTDVDSSSDITDESSSISGGYQYSQAAYMNEHLRRESEEFDKHRRCGGEDSETSVSDVYTDMTITPRQSYNHAPYSHR